MDELGQKGLVHPTPCISVVLSPHQCGQMTGVQAPQSGCLYKHRRTIWDFQKCLGFCS
ncbi:hypothetical protein GALMADRAFT_254784 [Galerina marginata CBS 339.88]|uniref:Uncharacterized protein n=1 Tax=Galerina marginata (strain CBS 339.88) TaxID=685588 RepID=A0A067SIK8_GALM3|nr:hypothetical protein GALMADRAFT_254784 [Galerina marginata CBS 339.88]